MINRETARMFEHGEQILEEMFPDWQEEANCRGNDTFQEVITEPTEELVALAKAVCKECLVIDECETMALKTPYEGIHGVWAGKTAKELKKKKAQLEIKSERFYRVRGK